MKPINCADIEPTLIEYFSSADDAELAEMNKEVPRLVLAHMNECEQCAAQYDGFRYALSSPIDLDLSASKMQPLDALVSHIDSAYREIQHHLTQAKATDVPLTSEQTVRGNQDSSQLPVWIRRLRDYLLPNSGMGISPRFGMVTAAVAVFLVVALWWQPNASFDQSIGAYQAKLDITPKSVEYVYSLKRTAAPKPWMAFSSSQAKVNPFLIGSLYAESIALYLQQDAQASAEHVAYLADYLKQYPQLQHSQKYLQTVLARLQSNDDEAASGKNQVLTMFSAFNTIYRTEVEQKDAEHIVMFEMGAWLVNLNLAALTHYPHLSLQDQNFLYFNARVKTINLPSGVIRALDQIGTVLRQKDLTDEDYKKLFELGNSLRAQLGSA